MSTPRRLALGLLRLPRGASATERAEARVRIALSANDLGYALVETFEVDGDPAADEGVFNVVEALAVRLDVDCLLLRGVEAGQPGEPGDRVEALADRARLIVVRLADDYSQTTPSLSASRYQAYSGSTPR